MIEQFYDRLYPATPQPEPLSVVEQQAVVAVARRLARAVRQYLYDHGSYGPLGTMGHNPQMGDREKHAAGCATCRELQDALDEA